MAEPDVESLPKLAYVYHSQSFAPLSIAEASDGLCRIIWVIDSSDAASAAMERLLRRLGPVVDASGLTVAEVAVLVNQHDPEGVLSMHDSDLVWTAQLAAVLGRRFHSIDAATKLTDKYQQRSALEAAGLAVPAFGTIPANADDAAIAALAEEFPYPAVLKPRRGQASRDTFPIQSYDELTTAMAELRARPGQAIEEYILEQFVPDPSEQLGGEGFAPFVSVESVVEGGRVAHAAISARTPFRWPFRETGYCTPTAVSPSLQVEILRVAGEAALALGVTQACLHTEIKLTDDGPVVIEVNGRPGGGMSEMLERASGFSLLRTALRLALGMPVELDGPVPCNRIGYLLYVFPESDMTWIDAVEGLPELRGEEGVDEIVLVRGPGRRIDWREGSEAHVFHLTGTTRDHDELRRLIAATTTLVRIDGHVEPTPAPEKG
ncbi:acetyl-CoA carboxylase biotin carboxylase subunit family protein [Lysinimonas soli]|uniref:Acetyl-CoA carboxylase biotin carboxylase subunit family protein n=1 Tax=Lysinimonas soli TaxID=1074233 RepID=A0ABW0NLD7_9MICO